MPRTVQMLFCGWMISLLFTLFLVEDGEERKGVVAYQAIEVGGLVLAHAADEADDGDDAVNGDGLERLRHGRGPADLDDVLHAGAAGRQLLGLLAPVGRLLVVDDMVGAVLLQQLGLLG